MDIFWKSKNVLMVNINHQFKKNSNGKVELFFEEDKNTSLTFLKTITYSAELRPIKFSKMTEINGSFSFVSCKDKLYCCFFECCVGLIFITRPLFICLDLS